MYLPADSSPLLNRSLQPYHRFAFDHSSESVQNRHSTRLQNIAIAEQMDWWKRKQSEACVSKDLKC